MQKGYLYERAGVGDFLKIAALDRLAWAENRFSEFIPDGEHVWRIWVEYAHVFCAREKKEIVGAILAFPTLIKGKFCIHKVFVHKDYQGEGIGSQLFFLLLKILDAKGASSFLTVDPQNEKALNLYQKWGFSQSVLIKGFYRPYEDRLVLERAAQGMAGFKENLF